MGERSSGKAYCVKCGREPGLYSSCLGGAAHAFAQFPGPPDSVFCSRCGKTPGLYSSCLGGAAHSFGLLGRVPSFEGGSPEPAQPPAQQIRAPQQAKWDLFICHAGQDKEEFVRPLAQALQRKGLRVWYDEYTLKVGDSLRRKIDAGLKASRFGVVVLSPAFFAKEWPQRELDGLTAREIEGKKVILPVWHNLTRQDVLGFSPTLADRLAASSDKGIDAVVAAILHALAE